MLYLYELFPSNMLLFFPFPGETQLSLSHRRPLCPPRVLLGLFPNTFFPCCPHRRAAPDFARTPVFFYGQIPSTFPKVRHSPLQAPPLRTPNPFSSAPSCAPPCTFVLLFRTIKSTRIFADDKDDGRLVPAGQAAGSCCNKRVVISGFF